MLPMPVILKEPTTNPSTSVKLKNNSEIILACYEKVIDNIRQLNELGELPNSIFTGDIVGVGAESDSPIIVQKMVSNQVVWHITCRNSIDSQNVQRARKRSGPEVVISPVKTRRLSGESSTSS